jgi:hypothetical protein
VDVYEPIRRGYHALGLGADQDVRAMFDQDGPEPACWEVHRWTLWGRRRPAPETAALALFGAMPPGYEIAGVRIETWEPDQRTARLVVDGLVRVRRGGGWEHELLPFSHVWSFRDGRVENVLNVLEGFELRRLPPEACAA